MHNLVSKCPTFVVFSYICFFMVDDFYELFEFKILIIIFAHFSNNILVKIANWSVFWKWKYY